MTNDNYESDTKNENKYDSDIKNEKIDKPDEMRESVESYYRRRYPGAAPFNLCGPEQNQLVPATQEATMYEGDETPSREELTLLNEEWSVGKTIGQGQFGTVYHAYSSKGRGGGSNGNHAAAKIYHGHSTSSNLFDAESVFEAEKEALSSIDHPRVLGIIDSFKVPDPYDREQKKPVIVADYVPGPTLEHVIRAREPMEEDRASLLVSRIGEGIAYMQERQGIAHKDLGPQNVKIKEGDEPVILDFGMARHITEELQTQFIRSRIVGKEFRQYYVPPEVDAGISTLNTDLYSLSMIWRDLLLGRFGGLTLKDHELRGINPDVRVLIQRNLSLEYKHRSPDAKTFLEGLERILGNSVQIVKPEPETQEQPSTEVAETEGKDVSSGWSIERQDTGNLLAVRQGGRYSGIVIPIFEKGKDVYEKVKNHGENTREIFSHTDMDSKMIDEEVRGATRTYLQHLAQENPTNSALSELAGGEQSLEEAVRGVRKIKNRDERNARADEIAEILFNVNMAGLEDLLYISSTKECAPRVAYVFSPIGSPIHLYRRKISIPKRARKMDSLLGFPESPKKLEDRVGEGDVSLTGMEKGAIGIKSIFWGSMGGIALGALTDILLGPEFAGATAGAGLFGAGLGDYYFLTKRKLKQKRLEGEVGEPEMPVAAGWYVYPKDADTAKGLMKRVAPPAGLKNKLLRRKFVNDDGNVELGYHRVSSANGGGIKITLNGSEELAEPFYKAMREDLDWLTSRRFGPLAEQSEQEIEVISGGG